METMDFSEVLRLVKAGHRMRNSHWPEGMFIVQQKGYPDGIPINSNTAEATGLPEGTVCTFPPYILLHTVQLYELPYVATQSDLFSEVWEEFQGAAYGSVG